MKTYSIHTDLYIDVDADTKETAHKHLVAIQNLVYEYARDKQDITTIMLVAPEINKAVEQGIIVSSDEFRDVNGHLN
jgi:hypothetical protein